jgi:hypothetical protein
VPIGPYYTQLATAPTSSGPWSQVSSAAPVIPSGSPGPVLPHPSLPDTYIMFCTDCNGSIGLASTANLTGVWTPFQNIVTDPVENWSMYYEGSTATWFGFTNMVLKDDAGVAFDAAIVVYWTQDLLAWPPQNKAVVLNRTNVVEPSFQVGRVGLPSVLKVPGNDAQLALLYDGGGTVSNVWYNQNCSVALAWLDLPLKAPF